MHSRHFVYSWMPEFSGCWSDAVWYWRAFVRSSTVAYSDSIVLTVGLGPRPEYGDFGRNVGS